MPRVRDVLYRFRPAGAPGAAGAAGVPADRGADLAAELAPLFAQLDSIEGECAEVLERGRREAAERRTRDAERARTLVAAAWARADAECAHAAARVRRRGSAETAQVLADARREAAEVRRRAEQRMPSYVDRVVDSVRSLLDDENLPAGRPPP